MIEVGEGVELLKVGDRVMCGMVVGTIAEELVLSERQLTKVPSTLSFSEAAGFLVGYQTAYHG